MDEDSAKTTGRRAAAVIVGSIDEIKSEVSVSVEGEPQSELLKFKLGRHAFTSHLKGGEWRAADLCEDELLWLGRS